MRASLLVLNYNGKHLLEECFESLGKATREGRDHNVILIDNQSTDESIAFTERMFPWVKIVRSSRNAYLFTYNDIVPRLDTDAILLLNNDISVEPDFIEPLLNGLQKPNVFAVNCRVLKGDRITSQGSRTSGGYHRGLWWYHQLPDIDCTSSCFFALGGQAAFSRSKFMELGGFDELFWPLYHEDIDLSYRAWRRGWRILCEPRGVLYHLGGVACEVYKSDELRSIVIQNTFLFQWRNIDDERMRAQHRAWILPRLARAVIQRDWAFLKGFRNACTRRKLAQARRKFEHAMRRISDVEAFARINAEIEGINDSNAVFAAIPKDCR